MNKKVLAIIVVAFFSFFVFGISEVRALTCGYGGEGNAPAYTVTVTNGTVTVSGGVRNQVLTHSMFANGCIPRIFIVNSSYHQGLITTLNSNVSGVNGFNLTSVNGVPHIDSIVPPELLPGGPIDCSDLFRNSAGQLNMLGEIVRDTLRFVQFLAPILVIVFTTIDYVKAMASQDKEEVNKATSRGIKRLIFAAILFFVPALVIYVLGLTNMVVDPLCGLLG